MEGDRVSTEPSRTTAASERNRELGAERAVDDPVKLARAVRIVRIALARKRLALADLSAPDQEAAE